MEENVEPEAPLEDAMWCVIGNIVLERPYGPGGEEVRAGTRKFRPGAKVVCILYRYTGHYNFVPVVGRHRASNQYIVSVTRPEYLTNIRAELVRSPAVIKRIRRYYEEHADRIRPEWDRYSGCEQGKMYAQGVVSTWSQFSFHKEQPFVSTRASNKPPEEPEDES